MCPRIAICNGQPRDRDGHRKQSHTPVVLSGMAANRSSTPTTSMLSKRIINMITTRMAKMMPANQATTGFRMNRLERARMKASALRREYMMFSDPTKVGEENNPC